MTKPGAAIEVLKEYDESEIKTRLIPHSGVVTLSLAYRPTIFMSVDGDRISVDHGSEIRSMPLARACEMSLLLQAALKIAASAASK